MQMDEMIGWLLEFPSEIDSDVLKDLEALNE